MPKSDFSSGADPTSTKLIATIILLTVVLFSNVLITSSFPQKVLISTDTVFNFNGNILTVKDIDINGANITLNGEDFRVGNRDVIAMGGRNSIALTGCKCFDDCDVFYCAELSIPTRLNHIIVFEQSSTEFKDNLKKIEINFKSETITIENELNDIYQVSDGVNLYSVNLGIGETTYITDKNNEGLFKVKHDEGTMTISLVGYYPDETITIVTTEEVAS